MYGIHLSLELLWIQKTTLIFCGLKQSCGLDGYSQAHMCVWSAGVECAQEALCPRLGWMLTEVVGSGRSVGLS